LTTGELKNAFHFGIQNKNAYYGTFILFIFFESFNSQNYGFYVSFNQWNFINSFIVFGIVPCWQDEYFLWKIEFVWFDLRIECPALFDDFLNKNKEIWNN